MVLAPERRMSSWLMIVMSAGTSLAFCGWPVAEVVTG
jgi:choline-glycine betaine transporter